MIIGVFYYIPIIFPPVNKWCLKEFIMAKRISELKTDQVIYRYIEARRPIIYINHFDFQTIDRIIEKNVMKFFLLGARNVIKFMNLLKPREK